jgi:hypothetical protein
MHAARIRISAGIGRQVAWFTRIAATLAVATQTVLLAIAMTWALQGQRPMTDVAGRQGGIFAVTLLLAGAVFWLTASRQPVASQTQTGARHG